MKTVLFFDRCELTKLYIHISKVLDKKINVTHVAFSPREAAMLEEAGINDYIDYRDLLQKKMSSLDREKVSITIDEIDNFIINQSNNRFNLSGSIQSDRGYSILSYEEALTVAVAHYLVWKDIFESDHIDIMYHEPCSMFMTHIAALLCKEQDGKYRYPLQSSSDLEVYSYLNIDGETWECPEIKNLYDYFCKYPTEIDHERCIKFLKKYRADYSVFLGGMIASSQSRFKIWIDKVKRSIFKLINGKKYDRIIDNIDYWLTYVNNPSKEKLRNLKDYKSLGIKYVEELPNNEKYYYYSMHLEPEATVLYMGDGIYANQIKLIENIAASLPPGYYLYVKDHPHEYAYRKASDYERLLKIPNIRLIHQSLSGKRLIAGATGIFTINGTAGFEALLLGKQVFCFGKSFYSCQERVKYIHDIRSLRTVLYELKDVVYKDDTHLMAFVFAYLKSLHNGFITYFGDRANKVGINETENAHKIGLDLIKELTSDDK